LSFQAGCQQLCGLSGFEIQLRVSPIWHGRVSWQSWLGVVQGHENGAIW